MSNISEVEADPSPVADGLWDVIVVGTGVGGATIGHRLAERGFRVLFLEKGKANFTGPESLDVEVESSEERLEAAYWPERITTQVDGRESRIFAPLGCGAGGSSILYAATLERFERSDIENIAEMPHPTGGWPVAWSDMVQYYEEAEHLYRVVGTSDPLSPQPQRNLRPPPRPSAVDDHFMEAFVKMGLHPYRLHVGFGYEPGCTECGGRRCERDCRSDARSVCLIPALRTGRAVLLAECEAVRFEAGAQRVEAVICRHEGQLFRLRARTVVLAAGAYHSPALLLRSKNDSWPNGVANGSGLVGCNLMFHANEWIAVWPQRKLAATGPRRTIGLRDFYVQDGVRLGMLQSTGLSAGFSEVYGYLVSWFDRSLFNRFTPLRQLLRIPAKVGAFLFGRATVFTMVIQDMPLRGNRVVLDPIHPERIHVIYDIPDELRQRARHARRLLRTALGRFHTLSLQFDVQLNHGHPCGTCRFGHDPATSVLDRNCKAHELDNLYVVDASFMPTSGGTNPSLTIAANALRVAEALSRHLKETSTACQPEAAGTDLAAEAADVAGRKIGYLRRHDPAEMPHELVKTGVRHEVHPIDLIRHQRRQLRSGAFVDDHPGLDAAFPKLAEPVQRQDSIASPPNCADACSATIRTRSAASVAPVGSNMLVIGWLGSVLRQFKRVPATSSCS